MRLGPVHEYIDLYYIIHVLVRERIQKAFSSSFFFFFLNPSTSVSFFVMLVQALAKMEKSALSLCIF